MSSPYLGEVRIVAFNYAPKGWASCNGQILSIGIYQALFSLLGTFYVGNGVQTFALPNLQGRAPIHVATNFVQGQTGGEVSVTLLQSMMPAHTHLAQGVSTTGNLATPKGNTWGASADNPFITGAGTVAMNPANLGTVGGSQPHENQQPFLVLNYVIALSGIFPSRN